MSQSFVLKLILLLSLCQLSCRLPNQNPKDSFSDGRLPKMLEKVANEHWTYRKNAKLIDQLIERNQRQDRLPVAVWDNGVDLFHPELIRSIDWQRNERGELTAGFDPIGQQRLASSTYIDPSLFAFGAVSIVKGRIHKPVENPLDLLLHIQKSFASELRKAMRKDAEFFAQTHFAKINTENFNFIEAINILQAFDAGKLESYRKRQRDEKLLRLHWKPGAIPDFIKENYYALSLVNRLYLKNWEARTGEGAINSFIFWYLEGADRFFPILKSTLERVDQQTQVLEHIKNYQIFKETAGATEREREAFVRDYKLNRVPLALESALQFKMFGPEPQEPMEKMVSQIKSSIIRLKMATDAIVRLPINPSTQDLLEFIAKNMDFIDSQLKKNLGNPKDLAEKAKAQEMRLRLEQLRYIKNYLIAERGLGDQTRQAERQRAHQLRNRSKRFTHHPFVSSKSIAKSHASHVTGKILLGNRQDVLIRSFRPLTESMDVRYEEVLRLVKEFEIEFRNFLSHPTIYRGLKVLLSQNSFDTKGLSKLQVIDEVIHLLRLHARKRAESSPLDFLFVNHIVESVKEMGRQNILFANISLGYEFAKASDTEDKKDPSKKLFDFLAFEYFKFRVSKAIVDYAPNSLFFVAAGNSGAWIDGLSKSALPFDLSSSFFESFERPGQELPNHQQRNIVGVMSSAQHEMLSSFTNLAIHRRVTVVVAPGEDVLSMLRRTDQSYHAAIADEYVANERPSLSKILVSEKATDRALIDYFGEPTVKRVERFFQRSNVPGLSTNYRNLLLTDIEIGVFQLEPFFEKDLQLRYPMLRGRYNGTSMATPNALQVMIRHTVAKAKAQNKSLRDLTGQEGFRPADLIADLKSLTVPLREDLYIVPLSLVRGVKDYHPDANEQALRKEFARLPQTKSHKRITKHKSALVQCRRSLDSGK